MDCEGRTVSERICAWYLAETSKRTYSKIVEKIPAGQMRRRKDRTEVEWRMSEGEEEEWKIKPNMC